MHKGGLSIHTRNFVLLVEIKSTAISIDLYKEEKTWPGLVVAFKTHFMVELPENRMSYGKYDINMNIIL
jgi:hypothetical protein